VAVVGSVMLSVYGGRVGDAITNAHLPVSANQLAQARQNLSTALAIAHGNSGLVTQINEAFVAGMHRGVLFAAAATFIGAIVVFRYLPAHGKDAEQLPESTSPDEVVEDLVTEPA
jgi:hypothetical protein